MSMRPQSPIVRQQMGTPLSAQSTGEPWLINAVDKQRFDSVFATVDTQGRGFISGEQAVQFFGNARLPEEVLAQIWDLADINSDGVLNREEFAVAMYLIRQHRGSRDGQVPHVLPAGLIPPSMRKQQIPAPQTTAPAFDAAPVTKPRSAADDLFGLDVSEVPLPAPAAAQLQIAQSTGGTDAGPFANPRPPPAPTASPPPSTQFKPFVPTSSFGQGLVPQATGQVRATPVPAMESNLLEDNDNEVSSKITNDAAELGNLSNQVGNLTKQMGDLQTQRSQAEQTISQTADQKRAFQERLTQLRAAYDQEVHLVKALKDQLAASQAETKRLQQDMAMIEGTHADLQTQHQQLSEALAADQHENAALKERIRQTNAENDQLKPQLEKLKSDARQQKGLVAINRKQLATNEAERDRIRAEIAAAQKEHEDATREAEETARQLEASHHELEQARAIPVPTAAPRELSPPPNIVSPTPSMNSNPFFRRQDSGAMFSPPMGSAIASPEPQHDRSNAFDSIFGPSFGTATTAPETSFGHEVHAEAPIEPSREIPVRQDTGTPKVIEPPAPEPSNQIESSALPFRAPLLREDSMSSSVKVAAPASRLSPAQTPRALTPDTSTASPSSHRAEDPFAMSAADEEQESVRQTLPRGETSERLSSDIPGAFPSDEAVSTPSHVNPTAVALGAAATTLAAGAGLAAVATATEDKKESQQGPSAQKDDFDDFFGGPSHRKTLSEQAADFDIAFASMGTSGKLANGAPQRSANPEFPDIQELEDDDSSEESDEEPRGFDDNFAPLTQPRQGSVVAGKQPENASATAGAVTSLQVPPPLETRSTSSTLPGIDQQPSPPNYKDVIPEDNPNLFPREYKNLLPERENPTLPPLPTAGGSTHPGPNPSGEPPSYGPEVGQSRSVSHTEATAAPPTKFAPFDFDSAFANIGQPPVEDGSDSDYDEHTPEGPQHQTQSHEFDPTFGSPAPSTRTTNTQSAAPAFSIHDAVTSSSATTNGISNQFAFDEFNSNPFPPSRTGTLQSTASPTSANATSASHDWDALFAPLNSQSTSSSAAPITSTMNTEPPTAPLVQTTTNQSLRQSTEIGPGLAATTIAEPVEDTPPAGPSPVAQPQSPSSVVPTTHVTPSSPTTSSAPRGKLERPQPGRALSTGTEHDDPILKRLTAMGWSRAASLAALEKFDYNIDKVCPNTLHL